MPLPVLVMHCVRGRASTRSDSPRPLRRLADRRLDTAGARPEFAAALLASGVGQVAVFEFGKRFRVVAPEAIRRFFAGGNDGFRRSPSAARQSVSWTSCGTRAPMRACLARVASIITSCVEMSGQCTSGATVAPEFGEAGGSRSSGARKVALTHQSPATGPRVPGRHGRPIHQVRGLLP